MHSPILDGHWPAQGPSSSLARRAHEAHPCPQAHVWAREVGRCEDGGRCQYHLARVRGAAIDRNNKSIKILISTAFKSRLLLR